MKKLFQKIKGLFILLFGGEKKFEQFLKDHAQDAVDFVETIKGFITSPTVITLISIFPKYAAKAQAFLDEAEKFLNELISRMGLGTQCLDLPNVADRVKCMVDVIKAKPAAQQADIFQSMSVNYLQIKSREYTVDGSEISLTMARQISNTKYLETLATKQKVKPAEL